MAGGWKLGELAGGHLDQLLGRAASPTNRGEGVRLTVDTNRLYIFDADVNAIH